MSIYLLASVLATLTGHAWSVFTVHGLPAICLVTVHVHQAYANGCYRP